jgi:hypothetical protein
MSSFASRLIRLFAGVELCGKKMSTVIGSGFEWGSREDLFHRILSFLRLTQLVRGLRRGGFVVVRRTGDGLGRRGYLWAARQLQDLPALDLFQNLERSLQCGGQC